ncbi:hypothetical protein A4S05_26140 [Nostoc sp. KVJ20]|uniref:hypothetical protein n=1 Tax=unclassified Nostoc TaxID=2593658 RepID=UPI00083CBFAE|nr:hypothetical protein [Nostoc sp. KVJ20]ODH02014.1 hypothetical protein A4S05_26140 [Nostoc sp. KVJ20]
MKIINVFFITIAIFIESSAFAQAEVVITPKTITLNTTRGEKITRIVALRTNEKISNLKAVALDSFSADNSVVLPAAAIRIPSPPTPVNTQELISFPVEFNLQSVPSGEFTGEIVLLYEQAEKVIPVIVRVKDSWPLPLITLLLGTAIGMAVSAYSSQGKLSDEVAVRLENLRTQIDPDRAKAHSFWSRADMHLTIAKQAHDAKQIVDAQSALNDAKAVWNKWLQQRPNWLIQFDYCQTLLKRLEKDDLKSTSTLYVQAIDRELKETLNNAVDIATPEELRQRLDKISEKLNTYIRLNTQLNKLEGLTNFFKSEEDDEWNDKAENLASLNNEQHDKWNDTAEYLKQRLSMLLPSQDAEVQELQTDINKDIENLRKLGAKADEATSKGMDDGNTEPNLVLPAPSLWYSDVHIWRKIASLWQTAKGRLKLFYISSFLISFSVLAGGGFNQLYWTKPTFGANGWGDYFTLLALGFGAEATRNVVTQVASKADKSAS